jgi:hypothetical protein
LDISNSNDLRIASEMRPDRGTTPIEAALGDTTHFSSLSLLTAWSGNPLFLPPETTCCASQQLLF